MFVFDYRSSLAYRTMVRLSTALTLCTITVLIRIDVCTALPLRRERLVRRSITCSTVLGCVLRVRPALRNVPNRWYRKA